MLNIESKLKLAIELVFKRTLLGILLLVSPFNCRIKSLNFDYGQCNLPQISYLFDVIYLHNIGEAKVLQKSTTKKYFTNLIQIVLFYMLYKHLKIGIL